jgi:hypothetical protein
MKAEEGRKIRTMSEAMNDSQQVVNLETDDKASTRQQSCERFCFYLQFSTFSIC